MFDLKASVPQGDLYADEEECFFVEFGSTGMVGMEVVGKASRVVLPLPLAVELAELILAHAREEVLATGEVRS